MVIFLKFLIRENIPLHIKEITQIKKNGQYACKIFTVLQLHIYQDDVIICAYRHSYHFNYYPVFASKKSKKFAQNLLDTCVVGKISSQSLKHKRRPQGRTITP